MNWLDRVMREKVELDSKILRLSAALDNPDIPLPQLDLMKRQLGYMSAYSSTLKERIEAAGRDEQED
jgi:hypothetical protein